MPYRHTDINSIFFRWRLKINLGILVFCEYIILLSWNVLKIVSKECFVPIDNEFSKLITTGNLKMNTKHLCKMCVTVNIN